jgi:hypothetical protein
MTAIVKAGENLFLALGLPPGAVEVLRWFPSSSLGTFRGRVPKLELGNEQTSNGLPR